MNPTEEFIQKVITAAKNKDESSLKDLLAGDFSLEAKDKNGFNAAMLLAQSDAKEACCFLACHGAQLMDFACGAAYANQMRLCYFFIKEMEMNAFNPDYNLIADYAEMGGHETTAHVFRNKSKTLSRENRNMALDAAYNGQFALAKHYANKAENRNDDFYCLMASWAGENGHHDIAVHFINQVADIDAIQFSNIAFDVALKGNQITAEYIVNKINKNEIEKAYTNVAFGAAEGGHQAIAEYFLNLSKNVKDKDYLTAACGAVSGGNIAMAEYFLSKMKKVRRCDLIELRHYASEQDDDVYEYFLAKSNEVALPAVSKQNTTHTASTSPTYLPSRGKPISVVPAPAASVAPTAIVTLSGVIASSQSSELVLKQRRIDKP